MGTRTWTAEQRQRQADAMRRWKPWEKSSGPKSVEGKAKVSRNAYTGGKWEELRSMIKAMNQVLRQQRDLLK